jgi:hypothetical protein
MADKTQPVSKAVPAGSGLGNPGAYKTLTTPQPGFGRYFGSGDEASQVVSRHNVMGKVSSKRKS